MLKARKQKKHEYKQFTVIAKTLRNTCVHTRHPAQCHAMCGVLTRLPAKLAKNGIRCEQILTAFIFVPLFIQVIEIVIFIAVNFVVHRYGTLHVILFILPAAILGKFFF